MIVQEDNLSQHNKVINSAIEAISIPYNTKLFFQPQNDLKSLRWAFRELQQYIHLLTLEMKHHLVPKICSHSKIDRFFLTKAQIGGLNGELLGHASMSFGVDSLILLGVKTSDKALGWDVRKRVCTTSRSFFQQTGRIRTPTGKC